MASKTTTASLALFLSLNLVLFSIVSGTSKCTPPKPKPTPTPTPSPTTPSAPMKGKCPRDTLKLGVCANVLKLISVSIGAPPVKPCCTLLKGLADLEAAVCLCTALKANLLGNNLNIPISLTLLLNVCSKKVPEGFKCA